jgi:hypothetical protein
MPDAQDRYPVSTRDPVDDDIWPDSDEFAGARLATWAPPPGKRHKAVASAEEGTRHGAGCDRIIARDVLDDALDVGRRTRAPDDGH